MKYYIMILAVVILSGCATQPRNQWVHIENTSTQIEIDKLSCEAKGYEVAGPLPQSQPVPICSGGFACGFNKGSVMGSNVAAKRTWNSAYKAGFKSCMFEKGYQLQLSETIKASN